MSELISHGLPPQEDTDSARKDAKIARLENFITAQEGVISLLQTTISLKDGVIAMQQKCIDSIETSLKHVQEVMVKEPKEIAELMDELMTGMMNETNAAFRSQQVVTNASGSLVTAAMSTLAFVSWVATSSIQSAFNAWFFYASVPRRIYFLLFEDPDDNEGKSEVGRNGQDQLVETSR